jgi:hypothetical protein
VKRIALTQGKTAAVDDADYDDLRRHRWHASKCGDVWYARRGGHCAFMHREIMERMLGRRLVPGELVDHASRDSLDNRRTNLRLSTRSQNGQNATRPVGKSRFKGVCDGTHNRSRPWRAYITVGGSQVQLGRFTSEEEAARAYDRAALVHFGEFARPNLSEEMR